MPTKTHRTAALILDHTKLAEQDLILTMLASDGSQERAIAKGGRKPGGRLAGRCDLFCEVDLLLARGRGSLEIVSEASLLDAHETLRHDMDRLSAASAICEMAKLSCFEDATDAFLYPITSRALRACEEADDRSHLDLAVAAYAFKVLAHLGWRAELDSCVICGDESISRFSAAAGGVLCESCSRDIEGAEPIAPSEVEWLRSLIGSTYDRLMSVEVDEGTAAYLASLAHIWATTHLDARLRAFEFMLSL